MKRKPSLLICGSLAFDELFSYEGCIKDHLPDQKSDPLYVNIRARGPDILRGGCGGNVAWSTALFSIPVVLFSWVGGDGGDYVRFLVDHGIDTSQIVRDPQKSTPRAILLSDSRQDQFLLFSSQEIPSGWIPVDPQHCSLAVVTAGIPQKTQETVEMLKKEKTPYIIDPGKFIMDINREELLFCIRGADTLLINSYEKELLIKKTGKDWSELSGMVDITVVTAGADGSIAETSSGRFKIPAVIPPSLCDPYGAGDAFLSGYAAGRLLCYPPEWSARIGSVTASFAIEQEGAQAHTFTGTEFIRRLKDAYGLPDKSLESVYSTAGLDPGPFS